MKANKIILNNELLIDLTKDTVTEADVVKGKTFHKADGSEAVGTRTSGALQEKTITENGEYTADSGYDGLSKVTVNVPTGGGGGECSGDHIIEVTELPTENIDKNAVYLYGGAYYKYAEEFTDFLMVNDGNLMSYKEMAIEYGAPYGFYIIPTKTTEGILSVDDGMYFYFIEDEGDVFAYSNGAWESAGATVISDISEVTENGNYALVICGLRKHFAPTGTLTITESGTHDVSEYASANVITTGVYVVQTAADLPEDALAGSVAIVIGGN